MANGSAETSSNEAQHRAQKTMGWKTTALFLFAETTSLGVLALPKAVRDVGLVPGIFLIVVLYLLLWYTGLLVYQFKIRNPHIRSFADGMELVFGRYWQLIGSAMTVLYLLFVMAAHVVGFALMMSTVMEAAQCKIQYKVVAVGFYVVTTMRRTLKSGSLMYIASTLSIIVAAIIALAGVAANAEGLYIHTVTPSNSTSLAKGAEAVSTIIVASMAHIAYPTIISEMKEPQEFPKALALQQSVTLTGGALFAALFYVYGGQNIAAPALGSAPGVVGKVAYGLASPSIIVAGVIAAMIAAKCVYTQIWRALRREEVTVGNSWNARISWLVIINFLSGISLLLAWGIPNFEHLFSFMGAVFGTAFALTFPAAFWFWMNWEDPDAASTLSSVVQMCSIDVEATEAAPREEKPVTQIESVAERSIESRNTSQASDTPPRPLPSVGTHRGAARNFFRGFSATVKKRPVRSVLHMVIFAMGLAQCIIGTYGSVIGMIASRNDPTSLVC